ncbi:cytochrome P450 [Cercophora scortea]|uniref:Cytochrome P450 n=1 Tax=Cercophora scortea TaxID=314031 RepID=A0AAE0IVG2_9PEZI|nr:cytochrome P450 [Cercophora scortea]
MSILQVPLSLWPAILGVATLVYVSSLVVYRRFFHPYAKIPGPFLPAVTRFYEWYFQSIKPGQYFKEIERLHNIYGPIVRISPNEVSLSDPSDYDKIYNVSSGFFKDPDFYNVGTGTDNAMFSQPSNEVHRRMRAPLSPAFSRKSILEIEDLVQAKVDKLCAILQRNIDRGVGTNLEQIFPSISLDIVTDYLFDDCWNFLDDENIGWFFDIMRSNAPRMYNMQQFPWLDKPTRKLMPVWIAKLFEPRIVNFLQFHQKNVDMIQKIKTKFDAGIKPARPTLFHTLLDPNATDGHVVPSLMDMVDDAFIFTGAAADTVGNTLLVASCHILTDPDIYSRLRGELLDAFPDPSIRGKWTEYEKLPYLTALIKESMRLSFGVICRLPRCAGASGATLQGYFIPPGYAVGMSAYMMHRNPEVFPDPDKFDPARWLASPEEVRAREKCLVPFSRGSRMCIGHNLAWCELYLTLGTLFRRFGNLTSPEFGPEDLVWEDSFASRLPEGSRTLMAFGSK